MKALLVLTAAAGLAVLVVHFGPKAAEALLPMLGDGEPANYPLIETLYAATIFGSLLLAALAGGAATGINPLRAGTRPGRMALLGAAMGFAGIAAATTYAWLAGVLVSTEAMAPSAMVFLWGSAVILFQTTTEEAYFRGWLQPALAARWGIWPAIVVSTLTFAMLHILAGAEALTSILNLFLGGLLFGLIAARGHGIAGAAAAHFAWNWTEQMVLGLTPNPGTGSFAALVDLDLAGDAPWGGSAEGLNASAAMTLALIALLVPLLLLWRSPSASADRARQAA